MKKTILNKRIVKKRSLQYMAKYSFKIDVSTQLVDYLNIYYECVWSRLLSTQVNVSRCYEDSTSFSFGRCLSKYELFVQGGSY